MVKTYKYFIVFLLLILTIPMFLGKFNNSVTTINVQTNKYEDFVREFLNELKENRNKNPIDINTYKNKGEVYIYNALNGREKILNKYNYTEDMVPPEYINLHRELVQCITTYKDAINIAKEGILLLDQNKIQEGVSKAIVASNLLNEIEEEFLLINLKNKAR